jgi:recombination protein U
MDIFYYLKLDTLMVFWNRMLEGGRKSFRYEELDESYIINHKHGVIVPYLDLLNRDLQERD